MNIDANALERLGAAESALAKKETKADLDTSFLPDGHPLKAVAEATIQEAKDAGVDLPPGHPMIAALERLRQQHELRQEIESERKKEKESRQLRKAKRIDKKESEKKERQAEEQTTSERRDAVKAVNAKLDAAAASANDALKVLTDNEEVFNANPYTRNMSVRLGRLLQMSIRGMSDFRMGLTRSSRNG